MAIVNRVSNCAAVYHPPLPPDYELDDYWMENIVLKVEKQAEDEFYSAFGRFSTNKKLNPPPPYVAARIAAAPRYNPFSSLLTKSKQPHDFTFSIDNTAAPPHKKKKKSKAENEKVVDLLGLMNHPKRKRTASGYDCNSLSGSAAATPHKKNNQKEMNDVNVGVKNHKRKRYTTFNDSDYNYFPGSEAEDHEKNQKSSRSFSLSVEHTTTAAPAPPHRVQDQQQQQITDVRPVKSVSPKTISAAHPVPAANHVLVLPDRELFKKLITAKMGIFGGLRLMIEKNLTHIDVRREENRLSIPNRQVRNDFLNSEEKALHDHKLKPFGCILRLNC